MSNRAQVARSKRLMLMFVEGCLPQFHCTINLRGDSKPKLRKVKRALTVCQHHLLSDAPKSTFSLELQLAVHVAYNLTLETAMLADECATYSDGQSFARVACI